MTPNLPKALNASVALMLIGAVLPARVSIAADPPPGPAASSQSGMEDRLRDLENEVRALRRLQNESFMRSSEPTGSVQSFLNDRLTLGGFFEPSFLTIINADGRARAAETANALGLNLAATLSPRIRFVTQFVAALSFPLLNEHDDPRAAAQGLPARRDFGNPVAASLVPQGYLEYRDTERFVVQGGVGYVPFGISAQLREPVLFYRRGGPQLLRTQDLITPLWSGVHVQTTRRTDSWGDFTAHAYSFTPVFSNRDVSDADSGVPGAGARLRWANSEDTLRLGVSAQYRRHGSADFHAYGVDAQWVRSGPVVTAEAAVTGFRETHAWTAYLEPAIPLDDSGSVLLYVFGDFADASLNRTGYAASTLADPYRKWEYGAGLNWLPVSAARLRIGYARNDYVGSTARIHGVNRDYHAVDTSIGVAF